MFAGVKVMLLCLLVVFAGVKVMLLCLPVLR